MTSTIHANAVLIGTTGLLIRGPSGAGKSSLTLDLLGRANAVGRFGVLVADDQVHLEATNGRLIASPPDALAGLLEIRGSGIHRFPFRPAAMIGLIVDLKTGSNPDRLPGPGDRRERVLEVDLPRLAVPAYQSATIERIMLTLTGNPIADDL